MSTLKMFKATFIKVSTNFRDKHKMLTLLIGFCYSALILHRKIMFAKKETLKFKALQIIYLLSLRKQKGQNASK